MVSTFIVFFYSYSLGYGWLLWQGYLQQECMAANPAKFLHSGLWTRMRKSNIYFLSTDTMCNTHCILLLECLQIKDPKPGYCEQATITLRDRMQQVSSAFKYMWRNLHIKHLFCFWYHCFSCMCNSIIQILHWTYTDWWLMKVMCFRLSVEQLSGPPCTSFPSALGQDGSGMPRCCSLRDERVKCLQDGLIVS